MEDQARSFPWHNALADFVHTVISKSGFSIKVRLILKRFSTGIMIAMKF